MRLNYLAPSIVAAILAGDHPPDLTALRLLRDMHIPLDWDEQRRKYGFN